MPLSTPTVVIVGAGISGIAVWDRLRRAGHRALILDAGPSHLPDSLFTSGYVPDEDLWRYAEMDEFEWLRVLGVGGRANVWGGWCNRFSEDVFRRWAVPGLSEAMAIAYPRSEQWLSTITAIVPPRFSSLAARFGARLVGRTMAHEDHSPWMGALAAAREEALTQAVAVRLTVRSSEVSDVWVATDGGMINLSASQFVLAASPLETARILLASGATHPEIGRGITDHVCVGFTMIDRRRRTSGYNAALIRSPAGPKDGYVIEILGPLNITEAKAEFYIANGLDVNTDMSAFTVTALGEQRPRDGQRLLLSDNEYDRLGRPRPRLYTCETGSDIDIAHQMQRECLEAARIIAAGDMVIAEMPDPMETRRVFHPSGGAIMGATDAFATDSFGRLREWRNVWIADASVFPTSGDCHPTLTIVAHAQRVADAVLRGIG